MSRADIDRNPITGLATRGRQASRNGLSDHGEASAAVEGQRRAAPERDGRNPILGEGNLGAEVKLFARVEPRRKDAASHNPLDPTRDADAAADFPEDLRPNGRPGKARTEHAKRNPIAGSGDFGVEWDPIHGYAGRHRQLPTTDELSEERLRSRPNPLTGDGVASYDVSQEMRRAQAAGKLADGEGGASNPLTGENCNSYTISEKLNERRLNSGSRRVVSGGNPLTGENCVTRERDPGNRTGRLSLLTGASNPVTGANCATFGYNFSEFRQRQPAVIPADSARNPVTGENCQAFTVSAEERPRVAQLTDRCNPVTGEGCQQFVLCLGEKQPGRLRAASSPVAPTVGGNPLTGENLASFDVHREQRSGRRC